MEFNSEVISSDLIRIRELDRTIPESLVNWKYYWVTVTENDFLHKIHVIVQGSPPEKLVGWQRFSTDTCLGCYSQQVFDSKYRISNELRNVYPILQTDNFDIIKQIVENFSRDEMLKTSLCYMANKQDGPYMIRESVRRHIAAYIHYFILRKEKFEPIDNTICMCPIDEKFVKRIIPNESC